MPHVTLEDVARAADVSLATASRALNGRRVTPHLHDRVLAAAARLAYTPNAHARALAGASHRSVGVICHDVTDPYFAAVAGGVMRVAADNDLLVMLASTFRDPEREIAYVSMLRAERAPAILLIGSGFEDPRWDRALAAELTPYLDGGGRVAVLSGPSELTTVADRFGGFRDELAAAGVTLSPAAVAEAEFTRDGGYQAMTELLGRGLDATCVFALTDVMAVGAYAALRDHGLSVPGDISVAGFDDIPIVRDLTPPLTTVALPLRQLGEKAMELALTENPGRRRRITRLPAEVVLRASTAPARA
ncbi:LacI family transcriptional regulator [Micromonospora chalcea]|nr:LacI family transcriptional regulator [Micromonospora chalcea]